MKKYRLKKGGLGWWVVNLAPPIVSTLLFVIAVWLWAAVGIEAGLC